MHRSRNTRDALNKYERKENAKDTTNKPATVSNEWIISLLNISMSPIKGWWWTDLAGSICFAMHVKRTWKPNFFSALSSSMD